jgi:predicted metalloprotease
MRWKDQGPSDDLEDRRGEAPPTGGRGAGRLGIGGFLFVLVLSVVFKRDFFALLDGGGGDAQQAPAAGSSAPADDTLAHFISFVLDDVQGVWARQFETAGRNYERAKLVLFTDGIRSGCGFAEAAMGPFYCPADHKVYIDLGFYQELRRRYGAPGDFAQAYVLAHEVGHHVQQLLGLEERMRSDQARHASRAASLSVRYELQADCLAGVWAHSTQERKLLEADDVDEAIAAAAAVGDDRIQKQSTGAVNPETWTHGSSQQRVSWFTNGFKTGRMEDCDTSAE